MLGSFAYTSSILFFAAVCLYLGLSPLVNKHAIVVPLSKIVTAGAGLVVWFFSMSMLAGPLDYYGLFSLDAWGAILTYVLPIGAVLYLAAGRFGSGIKRHYAESVRDLVAIGAPADEFRRAVVQTLADLGVAFADGGTYFHLTEINGTLRIKGVGGMRGLHILDIDPAAMNRLQDQLAIRLQECLRLSGTVEKRGCLQIAAAGILILFLGLTKR